MATRAQERARGYQRPYARAGFPTEYAYRKARGAPLGHRSFSDLDRRIDRGRYHPTANRHGTRDLTSHISERDDEGRATAITVLATNADETQTAYVLRQRGNDRRARATFTRKLKKIARAIGTSDIPYIVYDSSRPGEVTYLDKLVTEAS